MFLSTERAGTNLCWMVQHLGDFKISLTSLGREEKKLYNVHIVQCYTYIYIGINAHVTGVTDSRLSKLSTFRRNLGGDERAGQLEGHFVTATIITVTLRICTLGNVNREYALEGRSWNSSRPQTARSLSVALIFSATSSHRCHCWIIIDIIIDPVFIKPLIYYIDVCLFACFSGPATDDWHCFDCLLVSTFNLLGPDRTINLIHKHFCGLGWLWAMNFRKKPFTHTSHHSPIFEKWMVTFCQSFPNGVSPNWDGPSFWKSQTHGHGVGCWLCQDIFATFLCNKQISNDVNLLLNCI